jgi:hypothetical protein
MPRVAASVLRTWSVAVDLFRRSEQKCPKAPLRGAFQNVLHWKKPRWPMQLVVVGASR